jgi:hypothetical protein
VTLPKSLVLAAASLVLMVVGAFGPWAKVFLFTIHGTDDSKDGWIVVGAAGVALVLLIVITLARLRWLALIPLVAGGAAAATAAYDATDINRFGGGGIASAQWGVYVALAGSIALMLSSLLAIVEIRRRPAMPSQPPPPSAATSTDPGES